MSKKKILFLSMTCRNEFFTRQNEVVKETWAKDIIENKYGDNVKFLFYDGWNNQFALDEDNHILHTRCEDDTANTFKKTYYALSVIEQNFDFDYIFRTNTSTYINVPLAIEFINSLENDDVLWTSELLSLVEAPTPFPLDLYGRGNGLILSKKLVHILLEYGANMLYMEKCDDWIIGNVLNSYFIKNSPNYQDHIKSYCHGWFKCVPHLQDAGNNHKLCEFFNDNCDFEFLKKFMTIQIKQYYNRENEENNYKELHDIFENNKDNDIKTSIEKSLEYSKNTSIFIGSILGYIDLEQYNKINKQNLWDLEVSHKAKNDIFREKFKNRLWL